MFQRSTILPLIGDSKSKLSNANLAIADKALENIIIPFQGYPEIKFSENFNWNHKEKNLESSYQLYLQSLRVPAILLAAFEKTGNQAYLSKAEEIIHSWIHYLRTGSPHEMLWYDHAIGARVRVLLQYLVISAEQNHPIDISLYLGLLEQHAAALMDDTIHKMNNHGIMMDMALISLGLCLEQPEFLYKGLLRIENIFWQTFSETGMHQENSPAYHSMVFRLYRDLEKYLDANEIELGHGFRSKLNSISEYFSKIVRPNKTIPAIGDTSGSSDPISADINWDNFHDPTGGFTVLKNKENQLYLSFVAGFSTTVHKHADDLSITLSQGLTDFFVDAGMYNYGNSRYRSFVVSHKAHSSFGIDRPYSRLADNHYTKRIATDKFLETSEYSLVSGYNSGYEQAFLRRSLYLMHRVPSLLIHDSASTESELGESWTQRFTLHPTATAELVNPSTVKVTNQGKSIYLSWILSKPTLEIIKGDVSAETLSALVSLKSHNITETHQVVSTYNKSKSVDSLVVLSFRSPFSGSYISDPQNHILSFGPGTKYYLPKF